MKYRLFTLALLIIGCVFLYGFYKSAQVDREFDYGSGIQIEELSQQQQQDLFRLCKVWGFVKYYHPSIAKGDIDWDYELFRVMPEILKAKKEGAANSIMLKWIKQLGEFEQATEAWAPEADVKLEATTNWIKDEKQYGKKLSALLVKIQKAERTEDHHYISFAPNIGNPVFENEKLYSNLDPKDEGYKLLALFRYWNMIEYFFPYKHLMDKEWNGVLKEMIPQFVTAETGLAYKKALLTIIGAISDTHANIWMQDEDLSNFWGKNILPIETKEIENEIVVTRILADNPSSLGVAVGDVITKVNGRSIQKLIEEKAPFCPASNRPTQMRDVCRKLLRTNDAELNISIKGKGEVRLATLGVREVNFWTKDIPAYRMLDDKIGCLYPASLKKGEITDIIEKLKSTDGLVIDLRCYPSDFIVFSLGNFLGTQSAEFVKFTYGTHGMPGVFQFTPKLRVGNPSDSYGKPIVILVDETTQSQAEYTTMAFQSAPNVTVIGSTTAAADGNVSPILLPGNIRTMISGIGVYYPDGTETQRIGVRIDEKMRPTIAGIKAGKDELMERAMAILASK
jgi:hypothetical protein